MGMNMYVYIGTYFDVEVAPFDIYDLTDGEWTTVECATKQLAISNKQSLRTGIEIEPNSDTMEYDIPELPITEWEKVDEFTRLLKEKNIGYKIKNGIFTYWM